MDERLLKKITAIQPLSPEEISAIDATMKTVDFEKGTILLNQGQYSNRVYFILEGIVRQYFIDDGNEITINFFVEEQWVVSDNNFSPQLPSSHYVQCCSNCKILVGNSQKGEALYAQYPKLGTIARKVMETVFLEQQNNQRNFSKSSPEQRYLNLIKLNPNLFQRVPQYQIASYLGITPESLSRIRKRISL